MSEIAFHIDGHGTSLVARACRDTIGLHLDTSRATSCYIDDGRSTCPRTTHIVAVNRCYVVWISADAASGWTTNFHPRPNRGWFVYFRPTHRLSRRICHDCTVCTENTGVFSYQL